MGGDDVLDGRAVFGFLHTQGVDAEASFLRMPGASKRLGDRFSRGGMVVMGASFRRGRV
jgi:hypothetical protein